MKRLLVRMSALIVLGLLVLVPAAGFSGPSTPADEPTTITSYVADFTVSTNGDLDAVETITVDFPVGTSRHGIFRFFDTHDPSAPHARRIPTDIRVSQDGKPAQVDLSSKNNGRERVVRIGDPAYYVIGQHVYRISYHIAGVLEKGAGSQVASPTQFYWNLIPGGWAQRITNAKLTVSLPANATNTQCAVGNGSTAACTVTGDGTRRLQVNLTSLAPNTPVTVKLGMDIPTPPAGTSVPWAGRWDGVLGTHLPLAIGAGVVALLAALLGSLITGRTREANPGFPLQYAPPEGIGPAQGNYIRTEKIDRNAFVASVMEAGAKGAVTLDRTDDSWTITDSGAGWQGIDEATSEVYRLIGTPHGSFTAANGGVAQGKELKSALDVFETTVKNWSKKSGLMVASGLGGLGGFLVIAGFILALGLAIWNPFSMSMLALVPGGFSVFALGLLAPGSATKRTRTGREVWSRVGGFHRVLSTPSAEARFDFSGRKELYTAYLPWAVAFDCADAWAKKYRTEVGAEPPVPTYFAAYAGAHTGNYVDSMVSSFSQTVDSAISSYEATQRSSSSGGGGGFSGGGGGGGGGGGSW